MPKKSVTSTPLAPNLPDAARELFEHFEDNEESPDPVVTTWLVSGIVAFAGLQFIRRTPWLLRGTLYPDSRSGLLKLGCISVEPWKHEAEVTGTLLRDLKLAKLRDHAFAELVWKGDEPVIVFGDGPRGTRLFPDDERQRRSQLLRSIPPKRRPGRPPKPESHYRRIALAYLQLQASGITKGILHELAKQFGLSWQTARDSVARARKMGYLSPGTPGRAGATAGPKLSRSRR